MKKGKRASGPVEVMLGRRVIRHSPPSMQLGEAVGQTADDIMKSLLKEQMAKQKKGSDGKGEKELGGAIGSAFSGSGGYGAGSSAGGFSGMSSAGTFAL